MPIPAHILPALAGSAVAMLVLSIPLIFGLVPRNDWYGVRTSAAMKGTETEWYAINRKGGRALAAISVVLLAAVTLLAFMR